MPALVATYKESMSGFCTTIDYGFKESATQLIISSTVNTGRAPGK